VSHCTTFEPDDLNLVGREAGPVARPKPRDAGHRRPLVGFEFPSANEQSNAQRNESPLIASADGGPAGCGGSQVLFRSGGFDGQMVSLNLWCVGCAGARKARTKTRDV
jgi:hypothetical protein